MFPNPALRKAPIGAKKCVHIESLDWLRNDVIVARGIYCNSVANGMCIPYMRDAVQFMDMRVLPNPISLCLCSHRTYLYCYTAIATIVPNYAESGIRFIVRTCVVFSDAVGECE